MTQTKSPDAAPRQSPLKWMLGIAAALVVGLLVGFLARGSAESSDAYRNQAQLLEQTRSDLTLAEGNYADIAGQISDAQRSASAAVSSASSASAAAQAAQASVDAQAAEVAAREAAVAGAEAVVAANTFGPGTYVVGVDIAEGTYRTTAAVSDRCYWEITTSGTNGSDIQQNDLPSGGFPQVVLSAGQDFNSNRCGSWTLQG